MRHMKLLQVPLKGRWPMLERRRRRRFPIRQPIFLNLQGQTACPEIRGITENVSETGVLLVAAHDVALGAKLEVTISMPNGVELYALGIVVRNKPLSDGEKKTAIAVECTDSFAEISHHAYGAGRV